MNELETRAMFEMMDRQIRFQAWIASSIATYTMTAGQPKLAEVLKAHYDEMDRQGALMKKLGIDIDRSKPAGNLNATGEISA